MKVLILRFFTVLSFIALMLSACKKNQNTMPAPTVPIISSFSPASDTVGSQVTITGVNFSSTPNGNTVKFNGVSATVISASTTLLIAKVPIGATTGFITLSVNSSLATSATVFTVLPTIEITSFAPVAGIGYPLTINGINFGSDTSKIQVSINNTSASVVSVTNSQVVVIISKGTTSGKIIVTVNGQSASSFTDIIIKALVATTFAGNGALGSDNGQGNVASFGYPAGIVSDASGNLYITDTYNNEIRKITIDGQVSTLTGKGINSGHIDGDISIAQFDGPTGIAIDKDGNLYISEPEYNDIRKITPQGIVSTLAGSSSGFAGFADGTGSSAFFANPYGLAVDAEENVYVVDNGNSRIRKITPFGVVTTLAGSSQSGSADGLGAAASFSYPLAIAIDAVGNLYVTDNGSEIRKITPAGQVYTFAGSIIQGNADGIGTAASFNIPAGIAIDNGGNLYVADNSNGTIRFVTPMGLVVTLAGNGIISSLDGIGNFASFQNPYGITFDPSGNLYVLDNQSNKIRKVVIQ